jgi:hypothetical protein
MPVISRFAKKGMPVTVLQPKPYDQSPIDSILRLLHDVVADSDNLTKRYFPLTSSVLPVLGAP